MANTFTVDKHPQKKAIIKDILSGMSETKIADKYGLIQSSVHRYKNGKLMKMLADIWDERNTEAGKTLIERFEEVAEMLKKQLLACQEWLQDPDEPDKYTVAPRASEVIIIAEWWDDEGRTHRKKEHLDSLLREIRDEGRTPTAILFANQDTRKILLETAKVIQANLEQIAKLQGAISDVIVAQNNPTIILSEIGGVVLNNITLPGDREAVVAELRRLQAERQ